MSIKDVLILKQSISELPVAHFLKRGLVQTLLYEMNFIYHVYTWLPFKINTMDTMLLLRFLWH